MIMNWQFGSLKLVIGKMSIDEANKPLQPTAFGLG
jgi:hypothetical protein